MVVLSSLNPSSLTPALPQGLFPAAETASPTALPPELVERAEQRLNAALQPSPGLSSGKIDEKFMAALSRFAASRGVKAPAQGGALDQQKLAALLALLLGEADPEAVQRALQALGSQAPRSAPPVANPRGTSPSAPSGNGGSFPLRSALNTGAAPGSNAFAPPPSAGTRAPVGGTGPAVTSDARSAPRTPGQKLSETQPGTRNANLTITRQSDSDNCGKAAVAMALSAFSGKHESDTQWGESAISLNGTLNGELAKYGARTEEHDWNRQDFSRIDACLAKGNPVIIGSGFGSTSGFGHFVTLAGMRGEGASKEYLVADPNGGKQYWAKQSDIQRAPPHSIGNCNVVITTHTS